MITSEDLIKKDCAGGCGRLAPLGATCCPDCEELHGMLARRRAAVADRNRLYAVPPRSEMGVILHHYPERCPLGDVFPPFTLRENLITVALVVCSLSAAVAVVWVMMRLVISICLWLSAPAGSVVPQ